MSTRPRVVIGLGTGRCGTHSLADLLAEQGATTSFHQPKPCLPWHTDFGWYGDVRELVDAQPTPVVALVGWYYLNYVELFARDYDTHVVCLRRDRDLTIDSIDRLTSQFDHWSNRSPSLSATTQFRNLFPQYDVDDKRSGIGRYYDEYYERAADLALRLPGRVATVSTESLNDADGVAAILEAAGYADRVVRTGIRTGLMSDYTWKEPN